MDERTDWEISLCDSTGNMKKHTVKQTPLSKSEIMTLIAYISRLKKMRDKMNEEIKNIDDYLEYIIVNYPKN